MGRSVTCYLPLKVTLRRYQGTKVDYHLLRRDEVRYLRTALLMINLDYYWKSIYIAPRHDMGPCLLLRTAAPDCLAPLQMRIWQELDLPMPYLTNAHRRILPHEALEPSQAFDHLLCVSFRNASTTTSLRPDIRVDGLRDASITIFLDIYITHIMNLVK